MEAGTGQAESDWAAALAWWRDAGVDYAFVDAPRQWLRAAEPASQQQPDVRAPAQGGSPGGGVERDGTMASPARGFGTLPADLSTFHDWWLSEPSLDAGRTDGRVPPRGAPGAALMVVVPEPEADDREALLSGPQGRLLDSFLKAAEIAPGEAYLASAIPRHLPHADWPALHQAGLGDVLAHHVALVAPQRLMVLGSDILPLLGHDPAQSDENLPRFNHAELSVPLFCGRNLGTLLSRPTWKAGFWRRWLEWSAAVDVAKS